MGAALVMAIPGFALCRAQKQQPVLGGWFCLPTGPGNLIDHQLLMGSALFGMGWGLTGVCPGPLLVNLAAPNQTVLALLASVITGWVVFDKYLKK